MKTEFESNLDYQDRAISSVVDIFEGQEVCHSNFPIIREYLDTFHYNSHNSTSQASLQCSPREVV